MRTKHDSYESRSAGAQRTYYVQGHRVEQHRNSQGNLSWSCDCAQDLRLQTHGTEDSCRHQQHVVGSLTLGRFLESC